MPRVSPDPVEADRDLRALMHQHHDAALITILALCGRPPREIEWFKVGDMRWGRPGTPRGSPETVFPGEWKQVSDRTPQPVHGPAGKFANAPKNSRFFGVAAR